jgi:hypothetical protein
VFARKVAMFLGFGLLQQGVFMEPSLESHADSVKALLSRYSGADYRCPSELVQIHASTTVEEAIQILTDAKKAAAPVYDEVVDEVRSIGIVPVTCTLLPLPAAAKISASPVLRACTRHPPVWPLRLSFEWGFLQ